MVFESGFNPHRPIFITPTYREEPKNVDQVIEDVQQFIKRLRQRKYNVRYFVTVERGSEKGRLHCHLVLWTDLSNERSFKLRHTLEKTWKRGFCLLRRMYGGRKGFNYASKYLLKDPIWYSYSRRPGLGSIGKHEYIERAVTRYLQEKTFIDKMRVPVLGELIVQPVHSGWRKQLRQVLGIEVIPETNELYIDIAPVKKSDYTAIINRLMHRESE